MNIVMKVKEDLPKCRLNILILLIQGHLYEGLIESFEINRGEKER